MAKKKQTIALPTYNRPAPKIYSLDKTKILKKGKDPVIRDVVVFGPTLLKKFIRAGRALPWTIGMKGYRWSKLENRGQPKVLSVKEANDFALKSIRLFRDFERIYEPGLESTNGNQTPMDVDILVPTLLVVVSPAPSLTFDDPPITAKVSFADDKPSFKPLDANCKSMPRRWAFHDNNPIWGASSLNERRAHVLTWISEYDAGPNHGPVKLSVHNYNMVFDGARVNSEDEAQTNPRRLPIIFDPGNNNGGVGNNP
ncbi:MAG: hypothetical protein AAGI14_07420 [Pseudomonadota bacterium]